LRGLRLWALLISYSLVGVGLVESWPTEAKSEEAAPATEPAVHEPLRLTVEPASAAPMSVSLRPVARHTEPEWHPVVASMTQDDVECLAKNIYFEARNQSTRGQEAVAWVTFNRVADPNYPNTVCEVVWEPGDFSWTNDGKSDTPDDREAFRRAAFIAVDVMKQYGHVEDPTNGSIMYHADYVDPYWVPHYSQVVQIESHIFYNEG
jgi:N-acetylmuramoyl-L-alanine amidase